MAGLQVNKKVDMPVDFNLKFFQIWGFSPPQATRKPTLDVNSWKTLMILDHFGPCQVPIVQLTKAVGVFFPQEKGVRKSKTYHGEVG